MKTRCLLVSLLCLTIAAPPAAAVCKTVPERLAQLVSTPDFAQHVAELGINPTKNQLYFVTFDHREGKWTIFKWVATKTQATANDFTVRTFTLDKDGLPQVLLGSNERALFVLTHTNPPLYTVTKAAPVISDSENLANLKSVIDTFAKLFQTIVFTSAGGVQTTSVLPGVTIERIPPETTVKALKSAMETARDVNDQVTNLKNDSIRLLSYAEFGDAPPGPKPADVAGALKKVREAFSEVRKQRDALANSEFGLQHNCESLLTTVKKADKLNLDDPSADKQKKKEINDEIDATSSCSERARAAAHDALLTAENYETYVKNTTAFLGMVSAADTVLTSEDAARTSAASMAVMFAHLDPSDPCDFTDGIIIADAPDKIEFGQTGLVKITVAESNPFGNTFKHRGNGAGEHSYRTRNPVDSRIGFGVALVYTPIADPTFKAVTNPAKNDEKVIGKSSEKPRAGDLALLGSYRLNNSSAPIGYGLQFGVGTTSDLETFLGLSFDLGPYIRLGGGITGQQITALQSGQHAMKLNNGTPDPATLTVVASDSDIRTKKRLRTSGYASLTISLDSLPFFKKTQ